MEYMAFLLQLSLGLLLAHSWVELTLGLAMKINPNHSVASTVRGWTHTAGFAPATSFICQDLPLHGPVCLFWGLWDGGTLLQVNVRAVWPPGESAPRPGWPQLADSYAGMSSAGQGVQGMGSCTPPGCMEGSVHPGKMASVSCVYWLLERMPGFLMGSFLSLADRVPTDFHSQVLCGPLFLVCTGEPGMGLLTLPSTQPLWGKGSELPSVPMRYSSEGPLQLR